MSTFLEWLLHPTTLLAAVHAIVVSGLLLRVLMVRAQPGTALAWMLLVSSIPLLGILLYLLFGERRIGLRRAERLADQRTRAQRLLDRLAQSDAVRIDWDRHPDACQTMHTLGLHACGIPTLNGNRLQLFSQPGEILEAQIADIDQAQHAVQMMFYIWHPGGLADEVVEALLRARKRGVACRVIVDALGSATWWKCPLRRRLQQAGVPVVRAMPTGVIRAITARNDLRLHRKIMVVDGQLAWTGSMNLVDPRFFKQESGVGQWVDAMARVEGPAVVPLLGILLSDLQLETGESLDTLSKEARLRELGPVGRADVQVIPSGPSGDPRADGLLQMILNLVYAAREELTITTPYFIPEESMLRALRGAAGRGVRVRLIVPLRVDSKLVRYASRSYFEDLLEAGVEIHQFDDGLLHTKSMTVDHCLTMFGTVNLDLRSLWLNYEVSLFVYDAQWCNRVRELQQTYLSRSHPIDPRVWKNRPTPVRMVENVMRLISPLL